MKRVAMILILVILTAGMVPLAAAQEPAAPAPAPVSSALTAPAPDPNAAPDDVLYFWDFEGNNGGFAATRDWQWGTFGWVGNTCDSQNYPPPSAYSGTDMWGTVLNNCYNNLGNNEGYASCNNTSPGNDSILSVTVDLAGVTGPIGLSWWEWYDLFSNWDWAEVYANGDVVFQHCEPSFVQPTAWVQRNVDLTSYAGGPVTIEFHMMASTVVNHAGWYLDDVAITGTLPLGVAWDKVIDGVSWTPGMSITRQTLDIIVVQEVLHLTPLSGGVTIPGPDWQPDISVAPDSSAPTPETVGGTLPPAQELPADTPRPLDATGLLYLTSLDIGNATFAVYNPTNDSWTNLTPYETGCQMAVSRMGQLYGYGYSRGSIDLYDPATDTWTAVITTPPGATGQYCNLEVTADGEFLYTQGNNTTLWYTVDGVWNTRVLPFTGNVMGDYDPLADQYVIGQRSTTNAHMIDVHSWAITDFTSSVGNGEWARFGAILDNRYYFEAGGSNIHSFDLSNPALPPQNHGVNVGAYTSAAADRANAVIYVADLSGATLKRYDPTTNTVTNLTGHGGSQWHSSLAYVVAIPSVYAQTEAWDPTHLSLVDWEATGGEVITGSGVLTWTGGITTVATITLTKWFRVEPCTWTTTLLQEELQLEGELLETRPVTVNKQLPELAINISTPGPSVCPGGPAQFTLDYINTGGYENDVMVRGEFPPEAPFSSANPPPDAVDPAGMWAEWLVGDLPHGVQGSITVTAAVTDTVLPGQLITFSTSIWNHVGQLADQDEASFEVAPPDIYVGAASVWAEFCPGESAALGMDICNNGLCELQWNIGESIPVPWLSEEPLSGTLAQAECGVITVTLDSAGLPVGDYLADMVITSNDVDQPEITIPVTMTVVAPVGIVSVTYGVADLTVSFTSVVTGFPPIFYQWDFGDGATSTETNPIHTYAAGGCYTVTLEAANPCGLDSWVGNVCVCEPVHDAGFSWYPPTPVVDEAVYLTATAAGTGPFTYEWDLGDGTTATGQYVNHAYAAEGAYTVVMTATGECGFQVVSHDITVVSGCILPGGAGFTWTPITPTAGVTVDLAGTVLTGTAPLAWDWAFSDGGTATGQNVSHVFAMAGSYVVTLTVSNGCGAEAVTYTIVVAGACQPPAGADFDWTPLNPRVGDVVTFNGAAAGTEPIAYTWAFGDGGTGSGATVAHTYAFSGTYAVVMTATNGCGHDVMGYDVVVSAEGPATYYIYLPLLFKAP